MIWEEGIASFILQINGEIQEREITWSRPCSLQAVEFRFQLTLWEPEDHVISPSLLQSLFLPWMPPRPVHEARVFQNHLDHHRFPGLLQETELTSCRQGSSWIFPGGSDGKESACNAGDPGSVLGSGRSPGGGHGNPLQKSSLENPMDRRAWQAIVHGVAESQTQLSD